MSDAESHVQTDGEDCKEEEETGRGEGEGTETSATEDNNSSNENHPIIISTVPSSPPSLPSSSHHRKRKPKNRSTETQSTSRKRQRSSVISSNFFSSLNSNADTASNHPPPPPPSSSPPRLPISPSRRPTSPSPPPPPISPSFHPLSSPPSPSGGDEKKYSSSSSSVGQVSGSSSLSSSSSATDHIWDDADETIPTRIGFDRNFDWNAPKWGLPGIWCYLCRVIPKDKLSKAATANEAVRDVFNQIANKSGFLEACDDVYELYESTLRRRDVELPSYPSNTNHNRSSAHSNVIVQEEYPEWPRQMIMRHFIYHEQNSTAFKRLTSMRCMEMAEFVYSHGVYQIDRLGRESIDTKKGELYMKIVDKAIRYTDSDRRTSSGPNNS